MENYITGSGQKMTVHDKKSCKGVYCSIHNPSMTWPTFWRSDWGGFMEYTCTCGVGYPVPEQTYEHLGFGTCGNKECLTAWEEASKKVKNSLK